MKVGGQVPRSRILDSLIGVQEIVTNLGAETDACLILVFLRFLSFPFFVLKLSKLGAKLHGIQSVST